MLFSDEDESAWHRREVLRLSDSKQRERCRCGSLRGGPNDDRLDGSAAIVADNHSSQQPSGFYLPVASSPRHQQQQRRKPTVVIADGAIDASSWDVDRLLKRGREVLQSASADELTFQRITRDLKAATTNAIDANSLRDLFASRFLLKITDQQARSILERASPSTVPADDVAKLAILFVRDAETPPPQPSRSPPRQQQQEQLQMDLGSFMMTDPPFSFTKHGNEEDHHHSSWADNVVAPLPPPTPAGLSRHELAQREWKENAALRSRIQSKSRNLSSPYIH